MSPQGLWLGRPPQRVTDVLTDVTRLSHFFIELFIDAYRKQTVCLDVHGLLTDREHHLLRHPISSRIALPLLAAVTFKHLSFIFQVL